MVGYYWKFEISGGQWPLPVQNYNHAWNLLEILGSNDVSQMKIADRSVYLSLDLSMHFSRHTKVSWNLPSALTTKSRGLLYGCFENKIQVTFQKTESQARAWNAIGYLNISCSHITLRIRCTENIRLLWKIEGLKSAYFNILEKYRGFIYLHYFFWYK